MIFFKPPLSCESVDSELGTVTFKNGVTVQADLIIGADGIRVSLVHSAVISDL